MSSKKITVIFMQNNTFIVYSNITFKRYYLLQYIL